MKRPVAGALAIVLLVVGCSVVATTAVRSQALNMRPIIGVLAQPTRGSFAKYGGQYIAASYVKYLESAGARVVPIFYNSSSAEIIDLFGKLNGVFFTGGSADIAPGSKMFETGKLLYDLALKAADRGVIVPVMGHCLGYELLCYITSGDENILGHFDAEDIAMPLNFTSLALKSRMFRDASPQVISALTKQATTMNNHMYGVGTAEFKANKNLDSFYDILSTNVDRHGLEFVSTIESKKYPVYGLQWHPEKNNFEWLYPSDIPHSAEAVLVSQYMADFTVAQARLNFQKFSSPQEEEKYLIYNYRPTYTGLVQSSSFQQAYFW